MTHRKRIKAALAFERPDALPCYESPWPQTLAVWREQGMPDGVSLEDHFDFDLTYMYLDVSPRFEQRILKQGDGEITFEDRFGYTVRKAEDGFSTLHFMDHQTRDSAAWGRTKAGLVLQDDPDESARIDDASYFCHFDPYPTWDEAVEKYQQKYATDRYLLYACYGPWEATWRHRGFENMLTDVLTDPDWVREMAATYQDLVIAVLQRCLDHGMKPDGVYLAEDLGSATGPLMAPAVWQQLFQPQLDKLGAFLREHAIDFWFHCDGAILPFIDHLIDSGVQVLNPLEAKAGMDVVPLRKRYGKRLAFYGNIDVTKMIGPKDALHAELHRKIPIARDGGYILHSDHSCPPEVTYDRYTWMLQTAREIFLAS